MLQDDGLGDLQVTLGMVNVLLRPVRLYNAADVLVRECPVPPRPGVYAWYFGSALPGVPVAGCHQHDDYVLLYVGISPKAPPMNGRAGSRQTIRTRIRYHYRGNAEESTLRLTLGCLLSEGLGVGLRRVGSGRRMTFGREGEARLSYWMERHARVVWMATPTPWELERQLIPSEADLRAVVSSVRESVHSGPQTSALDLARHLLWVDDLPDNNRNERRAFEAVGFDVALAHSTDEALELVRQRDFAAVISDMGRAEGPNEGYVLLEALRAQRNPVPYFIYTGAPAAKHAAEVTRRGGQGCYDAPQELFRAVLRAVPR